MQLALDVTRPYSFDQTLAFVRRFPPCQGDYLVTDTALTAAVTVGDRAVPFTLSAPRGQLVVEVEGAHAEAVARCAIDFVGARDDLAPLYAAAQDDPPFAALVAQLHGLHHVRFLTLAEIAVYCVMMQRTPIKLAAALKRRFLARFGVPVEVAGHTLRAMPSLDAVAALAPDELGAAIGHARKGAAIAGVVRGVAAIGEDRLRTAPYAEARDALLAIPGVGPFSAAAILLRGLGRMDELPHLRGAPGRPARGAAVRDWFADDARRIYGDAYDPEVIHARYGRYVGYWSFYVKTGVARLGRS